MSWHVPLVLALGRQAGKSLRPVWSTKWVQDNHRKIQSQKKKKSCISGFHSSAFPVWYEVGRGCEIGQNACIGWPWLSFGMASGCTLIITCSRGLNVGVYLRTSPNFTFSGREIESRPSQTWKPPCPVITSEQRSNIVFKSSNLWQAPSPSLYTWCIANRYRTKM